MENTYGQFCTVARGAEVLCERWTPLVLRELLCGSKRFNDLRRGVPRMSTSLLAQRLQRLEEFGIVRRAAAGKVWEYSLTAAGEELRPMIMALGHWGARWIGSRLRDDELHAGLLMWDIRRFACVPEFPPRGDSDVYSTGRARPIERRYKNASNCTAGETDESALIDRSDMGTSEGTAHSIRGRPPRTEVIPQILLTSRWYTVGMSGYLHDRATHDATLDVSRKRAGKVIEGNGPGNDAI